MTCPKCTTALELKEQYDLVVAGCPCGYQVVLQERADVRVAQAYRAAVWVGLNVR